MHVRYRSTISHCEWQLIGPESLRQALIFGLSQPGFRACPRVKPCFFFPVSCVSQKPLAFQKHSLLLTQPKTHAKTLSQRSEKCATLQVLMGNNSVARAKYLQRALGILRRALHQV